MLNKQFLQLIQLSKKGPPKEKQLNKWIIIQKIKGYLLPNKLQEPPKKHQQITQKVVVLKKHLMIRKVLSQAEPATNEQRKQYSIDTGSSSAKTYATTTATLINIRDSDSEEGSGMYHSIYFSPHTFIIKY